jgi:CheY-like chemotaxis protein
MPTKAASSFFKDLTRTNSALLPSLLLGGSMNRIMHFEQVPLDEIRDIIEVQDQAESVPASTDVAVEPVRVLLADDSDLVRAAIRRFLLDGQSGIELVGEAANFAQTIQMSNELRPNVIIMDVRMPDDYKLQPADVRSQMNPGSQLLAISGWTDDETTALANGYGAVELLDKMKLSEVLIPAIRKHAAPRAMAAM